MKIVGRKQNKMLITSREQANRLIKNGYHVKLASDYKDKKRTVFIFRISNGDLKNMTRIVLGI